MSKILVRGPLLSQSGYGNHSRQVFRWLLKKHPADEIIVQVLPWGSTSWYVDPAAENGLVGEIMRRTGNVSQRFDMSIQIQLPNEWDPRLANFNVGVTALVEADRCNTKWVDACNNMSMIVVPSTFCENTLRNTGTIRVPVEVIPESFMPEVLDANTKIDLDVSTNFNFLILGTLTGNNPFNDRKNIFFAMKWICEEFANDPDVGIIIKTSVGRGTRTDWSHVEGMLSKAISEVRKGQFPKVHIIHGMMSNDEIVGLYKHPKIKALVAPTRGEGFGLPILEASACGLPVAVTEHSGHMDFMKYGKFIKFEYDMVDIHESRCDENIWIRGTKWAEVREVDFKKKLRKLKSSSETPKRWAEELASKLIKTHCSNSIDEEYEKRLGHYIK